MARIAASIRFREAAGLTAYARNARLHSEDQVLEIAASMREWGWTMPVLISEGCEGAVDGEIIAGHGRVLAAASIYAAGGTIRMANGADIPPGQVPVVVARGWSEAQRRAYVIADNQIGLNAEWDEAILRMELVDLREFGFDLSKVGFDDAELAGLLDVNLDPQTDPDEAPPLPAEPVSRRGDVWVLGRHRLLCGDSCKEDDVCRLVNGALADMVFTDPPYGVSFASRGPEKQGISGDLTQTAIPISFKQAVDHATKPDARLYFCGGSSNVLMYYTLWDAYLRKIPALIIWNKGSIVLRRNNYHSQFEIIFYGWKGAGGANDYWFGPRTADCASDIWDEKRDATADYQHPTQKPVGLAVRAIGNSAPPAGIVYEPFSGSGSTLIAAEMTGRCCYALEIDPAYVDVSVLRWQNVTGAKAVLEASGQTFGAVKQERLALRPGAGGTDAAAVLAVDGDGARRGAGGGAADPAAGGVVMGGGALAVGS